MCIFLHIYIYIYTHTHTHTHIESALKEKLHVCGHIIFNKGAGPFSGGRISPDSVWKLKTHMQESEFRPLT